MSSASRSKVAAALSARSSRPQRSTFCIALIAPQSAIRRSAKGVSMDRERQVSWADTTDCDDCRLFLAADYSVVMRTSSHAVHEAAGRRTHAIIRVKISSAVDPPGTRDNDAEPIGRISVRRAHVSRMPADEDIVKAWLSAVPGQTTNVAAALRKRRLRFPSQRVRQLDDSLRWIEGRVLVTCIYSRVFSMARKRNRLIARSLLVDDEI